MPLPFIVLWYKLFGEFVDHVSLTCIVLRHAAALTNAVRKLEEVRQAEEPPVLLQFDVSPSSGSDAADAADAAADDCNGRLVSALSQLGPPPRARDLGKLQPRPDDALTAHE